MDKIKQADLDEARRIALTLAAELDSFTIQELFQEEMEIDGYFTPIEKETK